MKFLAMHYAARLVSVLAILCVSCCAVDREAFTITNYDLNVRIEPEQHRLGARGKITLRNDSTVPQKIAVLQISSSLDWRSITVGGKSVQFVTQPYTSDIDHTGGLSEAIVTLPQAIAPKGTVDLEIAYEGVILPDATRLTRIGAPDEAARSSDWDRIDTDFTAVRGVGYVAWYPITTEVANLSEGDSLFEVLGRWKVREYASIMHVHIAVSRDDGELQELVVNEASCKLMFEREGRASQYSADCTYQPLGSAAPAFVTGNYQDLERPTLLVHYLHSHDTAAASFADAAEKVVPLVTEWFGALHEKARTADLPDPQAAPYESGSLLFTPLANNDAKLAGLSAAHQLTHAAFYSPRPWINEGLAHFAQALYLEREKNRQSAIDYMGLHSSAFVRAEKPAAAEADAKNSLVNAANDELYRSKAMCVWWMLRDMVGDAELKKAIAAYRPEQDKEPSYMARLIAAQTQRDLEWFFDDWVYRDRGLPDFKVESAFPRKTATNTFIVAVTVENLGTAGAEVPVMVRFSSGEVVKRLEVRAKEKATIRVETPTAPTEVVVNDGSVPESDMRNNVLKIVPPVEP